MEKPVEEWRDIEGYENLYKVSNLGNVWSCRNSILLKPNVLKKGYLQVKLYKKIKHCYLVSRLVALAFIPNPIKLPQVNHKDEVKNNNCADNLEWITCPDNINYGTHNKRVVANTDRIAVGLKNRKPINQLSLNGVLIKTWSSVSEINKILGYGLSNINLCCKNIRPLAYKCKWEYAKK